MVRWEEWWCASCIIVRPSNALHRGRLYIGNSKWSIRYQIAWQGFIKIWHWGSVGGLSAERNTLFTSWRRKICERDCVRIIGVFSPIQGCSMWSILKTFHRCYILSFKAYLSTKRNVSIAKFWNIRSCYILSLTRILLNGKLRQAWRAQPWYNQLNTHVSHVLALHEHI